MSPKVRYSDRLVEITNRDILFRLYYFPFGSKRISLGDVESITVVDCTLKTGKWRLWGTGDFRTWFPCDFSRPSRDKVFFLQRKQGTIRIGFTVEDSSAVIAIFQEMGLVRQ